MNYKNGRQILPFNLLTELQKYVQGELIYIPRRKEKRAGWGELNGARFALGERNTDIFNYYLSGISVNELSDVYHLSGDTIKKIIYNCRKECRIKTGDESVTLDENMMQKVAAEG